MNSSVRKLILRNFFQEYSIVIFFCILVETCRRIFSIYSAKVLGSGIDSLYLQDSSVAKQKIIYIIVILLI